MVSKVLVLLLLLVWPMLSLVRAQTIGKLVVTHRFPTDEFAIGIDPPIKCDTKGNIYYRDSWGAYENPPFVLLRASGERVPRIHWTSGEMRESTMGDFGVSGNDQIYVIVRNGHRNWLLQIGRGGEVTHQAEVGGEFGEIIVHDLAVISPQSFLVRGKTPGSSNSGGSAGIIDASGQSVREVRFQGDRSENENPGDWRLRPSFAADDGNVYLLHIEAAGAKVIVIAPNGDIVRTLTAQAPAEGAVAAPMFAVSGGVVALNFYREHEGRDHHWYKLIDNKSGKELGTYEAEPDDLGEFACYSSGQFEFLVGNPPVLEAGITRKYELVTAVPK